MELAPVTRRHFLRLSATMIAGAAVGVGGYASLVEPEEIKVTRLDIHLPNLAEAFDGLKIAQLSDLHYGPFTGEREIGRAIDQAAAHSADLAVITGDFVTARLLGFDQDRLTLPGLSDAVLCAKVLARLHPRLGTLAVLGNHDAAVNAGYVTEVLQTQKITVLRNQNWVLENGGARLWVAGVDDALNGSPRLEVALRGIPPADPTILLVHEPDFADLASRYRVHLQLSGHSHGGQVRIPLLGSPYLPALARRYPYGYYRVGGMQLYTNRGIGTIFLPVRLNAPPEVTIITLRSAPPRHSP